MVSEVSIPVGSLRHCWSMGKQNILWAGWHRRTKLFLSCQPGSRNRTRRDQDKSVLLSHLLSSTNSLFSMMFVLQRIKPPNSLSALMIQLSLGDWHHQLWTTHSTHDILGNGMNLFTSHSSCPLLKANGWLYLHTEAYPFASSRKDMVLRDRLQMLRENSLGQ